MGIPNRISATISKEDNDAVFAALNSVPVKLPFLIDLTEDERVRTIRLKEINRGFVKNSWALAQQKTGFLARDFSIEEYGKDVDAYDKLHDIRQKVAGLLQRLDDTIAVVGDEAYAESLEVYSSAKKSGVGTEGIEPYVDDMARRFARKPRKTGDQTPPAQK